LTDQSTHEDRPWTAAPIPEGSLYHYLPSKRDLALSAIETHWERTRRTLRDPAFEHHLPPVQRNARLFLMVAASHETRAAAAGCVYGCAFGNLALEVSTRDPVLHARLQQVFDGYCRYFEGALREAAVN
jgi:TetR/AcrR family transcriptional regulator, transcriptional repressor for nem operon